MISLLRNRIFTLIVSFCGLSLIASISGAVKKELHKEMIKEEVEIVGSHKQINEPISPSNEIDSINSGSKFWFIHNTIQMIY